MRELHCSSYHCPGPTASNRSHSIKTKHWGMTVRWRAFEGQRQLEHYKSYFHSKGDVTILVTYLEMSLVLVGHKTIAIRNSEHESYTNVTNNVARVSISSYWWNLPNPQVHRLDNKTALTKTSLNHRETSSALPRTVDVFNHTPRNVATWIRFTLSYPHFPGSYYQVPQVTYNLRDFRLYHWSWQANRVHFNFHIQVYYSSTHSNIFPPTLRNFQQKLFPMRPN